MDELTVTFENLSKKYKANFQVTKGYPEWKFRKNSLLRNTALDFIIIYLVKIWKSQLCMLG